MNTILLVTSGTGPGEVRHFVQLLARRMEELCEGLGVVIRDRHPRASQDPPRSVALWLQGGCPAGIASEEGTHALVASSSNRGRHGRKRWFAAVRVLACTQAPCPLPADKLVVTACRASGPGGQNVNKRSTAVHAVDPVSGIAVRVQEQRQQRANRRIAEERIHAALQARHDAEVRQRESELRAVHYRVERGNPVRTWCLDDRGQLQEVK